MPTNYNFKENWYEVIVPLLNTPKVKTAIKKGILGYMNNSLNSKVKLKSYKNIYDYLDNIHGKYYLNKNSSPADYSSCCSEHEMDWENELIDTLEKTHMIEPFDCDDCDDCEDNQQQTNAELAYEKYREDYLNPILKPYVNNYKKTHMDSYCLIGGCHWWNPTFCLTLAKIIMPKESWKIKSSEYHTTVVNSDDTKIFDILYFDETDGSFGGESAFENASMTLADIQIRNTIKNKRTREDRIKTQKNTSYQPNVC